MDNENKKSIDGTKLALWLLKLQARLDNLERYALDTAEEMGVCSAISSTL